MGGEDEVELDVTQLVQGTEEAKASADLSTQKMEDLLGKFDELEHKLSKMDLLNNKIDDLEHEVEKRNPTPIEKLEMRSFDSFPYNIKLSDYWSEKEEKYNALGSNDEEYVLTQDDIDNEYNESNIKDTFEDDFDENNF
jgi:predicted nuclease with TOPRIM domain